MMSTKKIFSNLLSKFGYTIVKKNEATFPDIVEQEFWEIYNFCKPFTMTSVERMYALYNAVDYIISNKIEGDFVECGVWRGGSSMLIAKMLVNRKIKNRNIYLYDTFEGMTQPTTNDISFDGQNAGVLFEDYRNDNQESTWCLADLNDVKRNLSSTQFPERNLFFIKGKVEDTLEKNLPKNNISLLRLDTDWYESTKHELEILFPILVQSGVLIIDDYGHWQGCRKAVDEYFEGNPQKILLNRIDYTGRVGIKTN